MCFSYNGVYRGNYICKMKRPRESECFEPNKRQYFVRPDLKRRREETYAPNKRVRTDECEALHRMLIEAYARIDRLEKELKESKFLQEYYLSQNSHPTYNHGIVCH